MVYIYELLVIVCMHIHGGARLSCVAISFVGGKYQFDRSGLTDTGVSTMRAYCGKLNEHLYKCILLSTTTNTQLPVIFKGKDKREGLLGSCEVTGFSILHGCDAQKLSQVTAKLVNFTEIYLLHVSL